MSGPAWVKKRDNKMAKVIVLGGCGAVGSHAVKTLVKTHTFSEVVIADYNKEKADLMVSKLGPKASAVKVDVVDAKCIYDAVKGCDLVLNCVGPFYTTVKKILDTVIDAGINYLDVCDDPDVTLEILNYDDKAKNAGISALIGMGASPGITNLLAKLVADDFLDQTESIDIFHTHGGEPTEGEGVIGHRFHCMSIDIPMFLDGRREHVKYFEESGRALRQTFDFPLIGKKIPIFPYPHPEQLTLPDYINVRQVTNKGSVLPIEYYKLTSELCRLGLISRDPMEIKGQNVIPYEFAVAFLIKERDRMLREMDFGEQRGAMSIIVKGKKDGKYQEYRIHTISQGQALGEGTGIPAAAGAILMQEGKISRKGVFPPEGGVNPHDFIKLIKPLMNVKAQKDENKDSKADANIIVEFINEKGEKTFLDM